MLIPRDQRLIDYKRRLRIALRTLEDTEDMWIPDIVAEVRKMGTKP